LLIIISVLILAVSSALFFFYMQAFCEKALRREFSRPYFQDIIQAIQLEYPGLRDSVASDASLDYSYARFTLRCDFITLEYMLNNNDPAHWHLPRREKILILYFRFLLFWLPIRHAFKLGEKEAVLRLATVLQYFANSLGEKLSAIPLGNPQAGSGSPTRLHFRGNL
jgi:hypothetical protein